MKKYYTLGPIFKCWGLLFPFLAKKFWKEFCILAPLQMFSIEEAGGRTSSINIWDRNGKDFFSLAPLPVHFVGWHLSYEVSSVLLKLHKEPLEISGEISASGFHSLFQDHTSICKEMYLSFCSVCMLLNLWNVGKLLFFRSRIFKGF